MIGHVAPKAETGDAEWLNNAFWRWWLLAGGVVGKAGDDMRWALLNHWKGPNRHYHTQTHLIACLRDFLPARNLARRPLEVELALWCHDAIYDSKRDDNEWRSAAIAEKIARAVGWGKPALGRVRHLILATAHDRGAEKSDQELMLDVDLAILGAVPTAFDKYEADIRQEYFWVLDADFKAGRAKILRRFMARPTIYNTRLFQTQYEDQARINLRRSLAKLEA